MYKATPKAIRRVLTARFQPWVFFFGLETATRETKPLGDKIMAGKKSVILHAIKTNHFPEATWILKRIWERLRAGLNGVHFENATFRECCIMRGWNCNYPELFCFTTTHDLCDASFTKKGMEQLVTNLYVNELSEEIEAEAEFERRHPEIASIPRVGKRYSELSITEFIFERCIY